MTGGTGNNSSSWWTQSVDAYSASCGSVSGSSHALWTNTSYIRSPEYQKDNCEKITISFQYKSMDENCFTSNYTIGPGEINASQYELSVYYRTSSSGAWSNQILECRNCLTNNQWVSESIDVDLSNISPTQYNLKLMLGQVTLKLVFL